MLLKLWHRIFPKSGQGDNSAIGSSKDNAIAADVHDNNTRSGVDHLPFGTLSFHGIEYYSNQIVPSKDPRPTHTTTATATATAMAPTATTEALAQYEYARYRSASNLYPSYDRLRFVRLPDDWIPSTNTTTDKPLQYWPALIYESYGELVCDLGKDISPKIKEPYERLHTKYMNHDVVVARLLRWDASVAPSSSGGGGDSESAVFFPEPSLHIVQIDASLDELDSPNSSRLLPFCESLCDLDSCCTSLLQQHSAASNGTKMTEEEERLYNYVMQFQKAWDMALNCIALDLGDVDILPAREEGVGVLETPAFATAAETSIVEVVVKNEETKKAKGVKKKVHSLEKAALNRTNNSTKTKNVLRFVRLPDDWVPRQNSSNGNNDGNPLQYWPALIYESYGELVCDLGKDVSPNIKAKFVIRHVKYSEKDVVVARLLRWDASLAPTSGENTSSSSCGEGDSAYAVFSPEPGLHIVEIDATLDELDSPNSSCVLSFNDAQYDLETCCTALLQQHSAASNGMKRTEEEKRLYNYAMQFQKAFDMALTCISPAAAAAAIEETSNVKVAVLEPAAFPNQNKNDVLMAKLSRSASLKEVIQTTGLPSNTQLENKYANDSIATANLTCDISPSDSINLSDTDAATKSEIIPLPLPSQVLSSITPPLPIPSSYLMSWDNHPIQPSNISELRWPMRALPRVLMNSQTYYKHQANKIVIQHKTISALSITQGNFSRLQPGVWICDETMNFFCCGILQLEMNDNGTYFYDTHFASALISGGFNQVRKWSAKAAKSCGVNSIFDFKRLFIPIHKNGNHWLFVMVDMGSEVIGLWDFLGCDSTNYTYLTSIQKFLFDVHADETGEDEIGTYEDWTKRWSIVDHSNDCPRQKDGHSCGVFVLLGMYYLAHGLELMTSTFTQQGIIDANVRMRIALILWSYRTGNEDEAGAMQQHEAPRDGGQALNTSSSTTLSASRKTVVNLIDFFNSEVDPKDVFEICRGTDHAEQHKALPQDRFSLTKQLRKKKSMKMKKAETKKKPKLSHPRKKKKTAKKKMKKATKTRKKTKAEKKAAMRERFKKRLKEAHSHSSPMTKPTTIDFSDFAIPSVDPLSQCIEVFHNEKKDKTIVSYIIDEMDSNQLCQKCMDLIMSPMRLGCCQRTCCFECLTTNSPLWCPFADCRTISPEVTYCPKIAHTIPSLRIHCPSGCGWYGTLNEYSEHSSLHCYQVNSSERIDSLNVKRFDRSQINEEIHRIALKAKRLQLDEVLDIRKSCASALFLSQCEKISKMAKMMDSIAEDIHEDEKEQREKESKAANGIIQNKARLLEGLSNSISTQTFGGGVHQTFDYVSWEFVHHWINSYAKILFGANTSIHCVDIGAGILVAIISGAAVSSNSHWIGIEIDPNRLNIGSQIYKLFLNEWESVSDHKRTLHVGFFEGDCTKPLNLRG